MKITGITHHIEQFELTRPYKIAFREVDAVQNTIVELDTDTGPVGIGAASPEPHVTGETTEACDQALDPAALDWLIGRDVRNIHSLCRELARHMPTTPAARAAIDIALHDLFSQYLQCPLGRCVGPCSPISAEFNHHRHQVSTGNTYRGHRNMSIVGFVY